MTPLNEKTCIHSIPAFRRRRVVFYLPTRSLYILCSCKLLTDDPSERDHARGKKQDLPSLASDLILILFPKLMTKER